MGFNTDTAALLYLSFGVTFLITRLPYWFKPGVHWYRCPIHLPLAPLIWTLIALLWPLFLAVNILRPVMWRIIQQSDLGDWQKEEMGQKLGYGGADADDLIKGH